MLASIVIGNYNYARFLSAAVESALSQTYRDVEVIVVDDGSTDESRSILHRYKDRIPIVLQENAGQAAVFNSGFRVSSGDIVLFLDSDDLLMPHAIETVAGQWRRELAKVHFRMRVIDESGIVQPFCMPRCELSSGRLDREISKYGRSINPPTSGNVYSRRLLERVLPMPESEWTQGNDAFLNAHAAFAGPVASIPDVLGCYRVHHSSMSAIGTRRLDPQKLRKLLKQDLRENRLIQQLASAYGVKLETEPVLSHWTHLKLRLASLRMGIAADLFANKSMFRSICSMLRSLWTVDQITLRKRVELSVWAIAVALSPKPVALQAAYLGISRTAKPALIRFITGA